ncbi:hypothetical protein BD324DRAFT_607863 [Kockovaella imperatae]|uniref:Scytalone dehydratase-like protein Arp1 N-terminal domain-containing protein n=1 Tax=Kockovaella imperatae TaxID=4999 RepID=A0A1Y1ULE9_9TREE|nr:hypothetical protein BD324DRAFT_607863 [Kockovaella imperatae]ORX38334.1 hypothetical protein BD324DRAFT_607863 [Kockovaella imperatae]
MKLSSARSAITAGLITSNLVQGLAVNSNVGSQRVLQSSETFQGPLSETSSSIQLRHDDEVQYDIGGIPYYSPNIPVVTDLSLKLNSSYAPVHIVPVRSSIGTLTRDDVSRVINNHLNQDDVLSKSWLENVILTRASEGGAATLSIELNNADMSALKSEFGIKNIFIGDDTNLLANENGLASVQRLSASDMSRLEGLQGPYLVRGGYPGGSSKILPVYRLYSDNYRSFVYGSVPSLEGSHRAVRLVDDKGYSLIPVPSRLYAKCEEEDNGVCGRRIGVKDIYDIKGLVTSAGSRLSGELYGKTNSTAPAVQKLIELGGLAVGKTKTASFAVGSMGLAVPSARVAMAGLPASDPHRARRAPWQPTPGWTLPSDLTQVPSFGAISLENVRPFIDRQDTAGILARDTDTFSKAIKSWYEDSPLELRSYPKLPKQILVDIDEGERLNDEHNVIVRKFLNETSLALGIPVVPINMTEALQAENFSWGGIQTEFFGESKHFGWYTWDRNGKQFYADYAAINDGRLPASDPLIRTHFKRGFHGNITEEGYLAPVSEVERFTSFINDKLLVEDDDSCSQSLSTNHGLNSNLPALSTPRSSTVCLSIGRVDSVILQCCADTALPIGQTRYQSLISEHEEMLPVAVDIVARKGCEEKDAEKRHHCQFRRRRPHNPAGRVRRAQEHQDGTHGVLIGVHGVNRDLKTIYLCG